MTTDPRDEIAAAIHGQWCGCGEIPHEVDRAATAAVLALPAIADAVALAELCAPLSIEQVAIALRTAQDFMSLWSRDLVDGELAIVAWEDKR